MAGRQLCCVFSSWNLKLSPTFNVDVFGPEDMLQIRKSATYLVDVSICSTSIVLENLERCMYIFGLGR